MPSQYVERTRWIITASKLKCFLNNPVEFKLKYVDEVEIEWEDKRCFVVGWAFDYLIAEWEEKFLEKYFIDEWLVKDELLQKAIEKNNKLEDTEKIDEKLLKKRLLPQLRAYVYEWRDEAKIRLTPAEWRDIMGMYREVMRQPIADMWSKYETHHQIQAKYKSLTIWGELDRFSLEKKLIRDWKTTGRIDFFEYDMENTFDYVMSMAFYYTLVKINYDIDCEVILDVIHKNAPYQFIAYKLDKQTLYHKMMEKVKPWLDLLEKAYQENKREAVYPLTWQKIPRAELMKSEYYSLMEESIQDSFVAPM